MVMTGQKPQSLARARASVRRRLDDWRHRDHRRVMDALIAWQFSEPIGYFAALRIGLWLIRDGVMRWRFLPGFVWVKGGTWRP